MHLRLLTSDPSASHFRSWTHRRGHDPLRATHSSRKQSMSTRTHTITRSAPRYLSRAFSSNSTQKSSPTCSVQTQFVHPTSAAAYSAQGSRPTNEDRFLVWQGRDPSAGPISIFAVFDGHYGVVSANICCSHLVTCVLSHTSWSVHPPPIHLILRDAIADLEAQCLVETRHKRTFDGTTLCVVLLHDNKLYTANVGDSRIVLVRAVPNNNSSQDNTTTSRENNSAPPTWDWKQLTTDHKVSDLQEKQRLIECGAPVRRTRLMGIKKSLEVTRALGDRDFKDLDISSQVAENSGLIAEPDIKLQSGLQLDDAKTFSEQQIFLLVATDGLSDIDFFGEEEIAKFIISRLQNGSTLGQLAESLVTEGLRYRDRDNSTLVIAQLKDGSGVFDETAGAPSRHVGPPSVPSGVICDYWHASEFRRSWRQRLASQLQPNFFSGKHRSV